MRKKKNFGRFSQSQSQLVTMIFGHYHKLYDAQKKTKEEEEFSYKFCIFYLALFHYSVLYRLVRILLKLYIGTLIYLNESLIHIYFARLYLRLYKKHYCVIKA